MSFFLLIFMILMLFNLIYLVFHPIQRIFYILCFIKLKRYVMLHVILNNTINQLCLIRNLIIFFTPSLHQTFERLKFFKIQILDQFPQPFVPFYTVLLLLIFKRKSRGLLLFLLKSKVQTTRLEEIQQIRLLPFKLLKPVVFCVNLL